MSTEDAVTTAQPAEATSPDAGAAIDDLSAINSRVDELAGTIGAIQAAFQQKDDELANAQTLSDELQTQLGALTAANDDLQSSLEEKAKALADNEAELVALRDAFGTRNQEFDALSAQLTVVEGKAEDAAAAKAALDARIQALTADVDAILAQYAEAEPADATSSEPAADAATPEAAEGATAEGEPPAETEESAPAETAPADAPAAEAAPADPMDTLAGKVAALAALLSGKADAVAAATTDIDAVKAQLAAIESDKIGLENNLTDAQNRAGGLNVELTNRSAEIDALNGRIADLEAQLAAAQAERDRLSGGLADIDSQLAGYVGEYGDGRVAAVAPAAPTAAAEAGAAADEAAAPVDPIAGAAGSVAAVAALLQGKRQEIDDAQNQIASLEEQLGAVTTEKTNLEISLNEKEQAISDLETQVTTLQGELEAKSAELEQLTQQAADAQAQLDAAQEANSALESQIATLNAEIEANSQRLSELDGGMNELASALEAADDGAEDEADTRLAAAGVAVGGTAALAAAARKQKQALRDAQAEADNLRQQLAEATAAKEALEASAGDTTVNADELNAQIEALTADKSALEQQLADSQAQLEQARTEYAESTAWQQRAPAIVDLGQSLSRMSDTKLAAANSSAAAGSLPHLVAAPQDLADVKGIGRTYEQRLYNAGIGSFWELAVCSDDDLKRLLELNELQLLSIDLEAIRADARRLAEETGTVGMLWDGEAPDDFEPIDGIGKTFEQRLYDAGIRTYKALAAATPEQLADIIKAKKPSQPDYQSWIDQARALMQPAGGE